jgi:SOS response regulatory protein OraA/RecX
MTICLAWSEVSPKWVEVREGEGVLDEIEVRFPLRRLPTLLFASLEEAKEWLSRKERSLAKNQALRFLARQTLASTMLFQKLRAAGYSPIVCDEILAFCKSYLSDEEYWVGIVEKELARGHGPKLIAWKWTQKGLPGHLLEALVPPAKQKEAMQRYFNKIKNRKRAFQILIQRGFDSEIISELLNKNLFH